MLIRVRYEQLLEKKELKQVELLKYLMLTEGEGSIQEVAKELSISKTSMESYLEDLVIYLEPYRPDVTIRYDGTRITLDMSYDFSLTQVERSLYMGSIKYRILDYIFHHPDFSSVSLCSELMISDSTLYRKIKELNKMLKEFDIEIRHGKIAGEESQIRYFYFQFYWFLNHTFYNHQDLENQSLIRVIEKGLEVTFTLESQRRLNLWLQIAKKRITLRHLTFDKFNRKIKAYEKDPLYNKVRTLMLRLVGNYAIEVEEGEVMLQFSFLISMSMLSMDDFYDYSLIRSRFTPTAWADTMTLETILLYYRPILIPRTLEKRIYYLLAQAHPRLYFFTGDIEIYDQEHIWRLENDFSSHPMLPLVTHLMQILEGKFDQTTFSESNSLIALTKIKYLSILSIIDYETNREIEVGVSLEMEDIYQEATLRMLMTQLKSLNGVVCEVYKPGKEYDLVITNKNGLKWSTEVYLISELGAAYDMLHIRKLIRLIYKRKNNVKLQPIYL